MGCHDPWPDRDIPRLVCDEVLGNRGTEMSAHCIVCGDPIFDENGQEMGEEVTDGVWMCDECLGETDDFDDEGDKQ